MRQAAGISCQKAFGALDGSVLRDVSFDATAIIRAGGSTPIATSHARQGTEEMDFDPVWVDDCGAVVCRATDRGGKGAGFAGSLGDRGCARTCRLVHMGGVHTACDRSCQTVPVDGAEACTSHSAPHNRVAHNGSPGIGHPILSESWTSPVCFSHHRS